VNDDLIFPVLALGFLLLLGMFFVGYRYGTERANKHWESLIPAQMEQLCRECSGLNLDSNNQKG
jgi:hypothetical protein